MAIDTRQDAAARYDMAPAAPKNDPFCRGLAPSPRARVLEIGCGTGRILTSLVESFGYIRGIDSSEGMLARCRATLDDAGIPTSRAVVERADITGFELGSTLALILAPWDLQLPATDKEVGGPLGCVLRHLRPAGTCVGILGFAGPRVRQAVESPSMRSLCVFCGSSPGSGPAYLDAAQRLGQELVSRGIGLVYGGAGVGLMGRLARTVLSGGGEVIGVIPRSLMEREVALSDLPDLRVVPSMHERKALMAELSDGFIALPGGLGTLEELLEALTWTQLGLHEKPCGLLNVAGYFDDLMRFFLHAERQRFLGPQHRSMLLVDDDPSRLVDLLASYRHPAIDKTEWILGLSREANP